MAKDNSMMSSPVSMSANSLLSNLESTASIKAAQATEAYYIPEDSDGNKLFSLGDGDFNLRANGAVFHTHKYILKRFNGLKHLIGRNSADEDCDELSLDHCATDFMKAFDILYASPIKDLPEFDSETLVSALRVASIYDYPTLRTFAIQKLENSHLSAIKRIQIAREFKFNTWEAPAYEDICARNEPITEDEANILGIRAFVQVAKIREKEQRRRARIGVENLKSHRTEPDASTTSGPHVAAPASDAASSGNEKVYLRSVVGRLDALRSKAHSRSEANNTSSDLLQGFSSSPGVSSKRRADESGGYTTNSGSLEYNIPDCQCTAPEDSRITGWSSTRSYAVDPGTKCHCTISPCAANALARLQTTQTAHTTSIAQLESTIKDMKSSMVPAKGVVIEKPQSNLDEVTLVQTEVRKWLASKSEE